jgi:MOSC domain-containing protein YiiM
MGGTVSAVSSSGTYSFTKPNRESITLLAGLGVEGDVHAGVTVKHRFRMRKDPSQPNLRELGENVTTRGVDLLGLPVGTRLRLGDEAVVEVTGLRNPCAQIDTFRQGLMKQVVGRDADGSVRFKSGIMGVVLTGGVVRPGDGIGVVLPEGPHRPLEIV